MRLMSKHLDGLGTRSNERGPLHYFPAERHDKKAMRRWLGPIPKLPTAVGSRTTCGNASGRGYIVDGNPSYFNARVRWTPPRIGERNNSLCPLSYFSRSSPW